MTAPASRPTPKPWSMKWIVAAIVVFSAGYTLINLYFRKPGQAYRPYQDAQDRATTARLVEAGWQKLTVDTRRPAEDPIAGKIPATIIRDFPGIGPELESKFAEKPQLLATIDQASAPAEVTSGENYTAYFTASLSDLKAQVGDLALYRKGQELVLVPTTETLPGDELKSRRNGSSYWVSFSTVNLPPDTYRMRIVAKGPAVAWTFGVK